MKRFISPALCLNTIVLGLLFFQTSWWEVTAFVLFSGVFIWNIYAYLNNKNMTNPPKMHLNVSISGDKGARQYLLALSIAAYLCLSAVWVWKYFANN